MEERIESNRGSVGVGPSWVTGHRSRTRLTVLARTTMTCPLPPEILDLIVDNLHDKRTALLACCVVSKSWIPRTRRHIFAHVKFNRSRFPVESWTKVFPDPSNSPAHYTQSLTFLNVQLVTPIGQDVVRWVSAFHNVVRLRVGTRDLDRDCQISFVPLRGLSPAVRSLHLDSTYPQHSEVFGLLCSFPLLEDFTLEAFRCWNGADEWETPLTSPTLSGSLELCSVIGGIGLITRRLLDLPSGPNFTNIVLACVYEADFKATTDLVSGCSGTIESLDVADYLPGVSLLDR